VGNRKVADPHFIIMEMKIIPFRVKESEEEEDYSDVFCFLIEGSKKNVYNVEISIDDFNDLGITKTICNCTDCSIKRNPNYKNYIKDYNCKHIKECLNILKEFKVNGL